MKMALLIVQWNKKEDVPLRKVILTMNEEFMEKVGQNHV